MSRIVYKTPAEIDKMRVAGRVVSQTLQAMREAVAPGVSTADLDQLARRVIEDAGGVPSFLGYRGFPASICSSLNEQVVHGIPDASVVLKSGDLVKLDVGVKLHGFHADSAISVPVGEVASDVLRLSEVTRACLWHGIRALRRKGRLGELGRAIEKHAASAGFSVVREMVGHGIGRRLHEPPQVPNYEASGSGHTLLLEGLTIAVEPMINLGKADIKTLDDGWTVVTADGSPSAHWEHTVAITRHGVEVLTLGPHDSGLEWAQE